MYNAVNFALALTHVLNPVEGHYNDIRLMECSMQFVFGPNRTRY